MDCAEKAFGQHPVEIGGVGLKRPGAAGNVLLAIIAEDDGEHVDTSFPGAIGKIGEAKIAGVDVKQPVEGRALGCGIGKDGRQPHMDVPGGKR